VEHKQKYLGYIATLRQNRQADKKRSDFHRYNNDTDLGMKSGIGLKPQISTRELKSPETSKLGLVPNPFISKRASI